MNPLVCKTFICSRFPKRFKGFIYLFVTVVLWFLRAICWDFRSIWDVFISRSACVQSFFMYWRNACACYFSQAWKIIDFCFQQLIWRRVDVTRVDNPVPHATVASFSMTLEWRTTPLWRTYAIPASNSVLVLWTRWPVHRTEIGDTPPYPPATPRTVDPWRAQNTVSRVGKIRLVLHLTLIWGTLWRL